MDMETEATGPSAEPPGRKTKAQMAVATRAEHGNGSKQEVSH
jgi:hypothetical protein